MPPPCLRALVLAAGLGTRLRPLTEVLPKPLMPLVGKPLVAHTLDALVEIGCEAVALNLHYRGEDIRRQLGTSYRGLPIVYSEEPEILGTLGALAPLAGFFRGAEQVLVINGDSLCPWPLAELQRAHQVSRAAATLLVSELAATDLYGGGVGLAADGRIVALRGLEVETPARFRVFAGAQILEPRLLAGLERREQDLVADLYQPLLRAGGLLHALSTDRPWHDLGSPRRYLEGVLDWLTRLPERRWISSEALISPEAVVRHSVLEAGTVVGAGAVVEGSLLLPGARLGEGAQVDQTIVGFDAEVPSRSRLSQQLVMPAGRGAGVCSLDSSEEANR